MEVSAAPMDPGCRLPRDGRASHAYLHALIEHNPIAIVVLDSSHCFQMCNAAFTRLFQYVSSDLESWDIDSLIAGPAFLSEAEEATRTVLVGEQVRLRTKRRRRDGHLIDVEIYGVPLLLDGHVKGVFGLYQNVTGRTDRTSAMRQIAPQPFEQWNEARRRFTRDLNDAVSHDLTVLSLNLTRLEKLLPMRDSDAPEVLQQTRELVALCGDQARSVGKWFVDTSEDSLDNSSRHVTPTPTNPRRHTITGRETEIVKLLATGFSSKEVALRLDIGTRTVETHRLNVYRKLQLRNIADLVLYAVRSGLLPSA